MKRSSRAYGLAALLTILACRIGAAQGCNLAVTPVDQPQKCDGVDLPESYCEGQGTPGYYCSIGYSVCGSTGYEYTIATASPDDSCSSGGGGGGGGCAVSSKPQDSDPDPPPINDPPPCEGDVRSHTELNRAHLVPGRAEGYGQRILIGDPLMDLGSVNVHPHSGVPLPKNNSTGGIAVKAPSIFLASVCALAPALCAQQGAVVPLKPTAVFEAPLKQPAPVVGRPECDAAGNIYARLASGTAGTQERAASPVWKVSTGGKLAQSFSLLDAFPNSSSGRIDLLGRAAFVTADGRIFQTADVRGETFVVEFGQDGSVKAKVRLDADDLKQAWTWHLAVSKSGEYLLTASTGKDHLTPFTGVFSADGRLKRRIYEPEDEEARQRSSPDDWRGFRPANVVTGVDFVREGDVAIGADDNLYLLHQTASGALVYVIEPGGDVVRKARVDAGPGLVARSIRSNGQRLAIWFEGESDAGPYFVKAIDTNGNAVRTYRIEKSDVSPLALACYDSAGVTMLSEANGRLYAVKADLP